MTTPGAPLSPEGLYQPEGDLPAVILDGVAGLSGQEGGRFVIRKPIMDPIVFDKGLDADARWDIAEREGHNAIAALFDIRLGDIATADLAGLVPERVFWRGIHCNVVETTLVRFSEEFSLGYEVTMDDQGKPMGIQNVLWHGDEDAVADFLDSHSIEEEEDEQIPEILAHRRRDVRSFALLALHHLAGIELTMHAELSKLAQIGTARRVPSALIAAQNKVDIAKPAPGAIHNGFVPPVTRNHPRIQPKPQNGNKRGKRARF